MSARAALGALGIALGYALAAALLGPAFALRMLVEAGGYALLALGLSLQWGAGGLFNIGIMGFAALGAAAAMLVGMPANAAFWEGGLAPALGGALAIGAAAAGAAVVLARAARRAAPARAGAWAAGLAGVAAGLTAFAALGPVTARIEGEVGWVGGLGLPTPLGWGAAAAAAAALAWPIGKICLRLRGDYLAIATLGAAEIVNTILKNEEWLTRGVKTVSPLPWPTPRPAPPEISFELARALYLSATATLILGAYWLLSRALASPWGRTLRAIRDNETAAAAFGKDVAARRLEVFVLGSALMGLGGAVLVSFISVFDPASFRPLNFTFLVWVMVIVGGARAPFGAVLGAFLIYLVWTLSEPATLALFDWGAAMAEGVFGWEPPGDLGARALQMRVFLIGLVIVLALRFAPDGLIRETRLREGRRG